MNDDDTDETPAPRATPVDQVPVLRAQPVGPPPPAPGPMRTVQRAKLAPGASNVQVGKASDFADQGDLDRYNAAIAAGKSEQEALAVGDNWVGAGALGKVSTGNSYGVAVPQDQLRRMYGDNPDNWRTARAEVTTEDGQSVRLPFVDVGPGKKPQAAGVVMDLTHPVSEGLKTGGMAGNTAIRYLPPGSGPDYTTHPDAWYAEQGHISKQFQNNPAAQIGAEPAPTPWVKAASAAPEDTDDGSGGYDQSFQRHLGGSLGAVNA